MSIRLLQIESVCSLAILEGFGGPLALGHSPGSAYSQAEENCQTYERFIFALVEAVKSWSSYHPRLINMSRIMVVVIDKQVLTSKFLDDFGFQSDGFVPYPKYKHKVKYAWLTGLDFMHKLEKEAAKYGIPTNTPNFLVQKELARPFSLKDTTPKISVIKGDT